MTYPSQPHSPPHHIPHFPFPPSSPTISRNFPQGKGTFHRREEPSTEEENVPQGNRTFQDQQEATSSLRRTPQHSDSHHESEDREIPSFLRNPHSSGKSPEDAQPTHSSQAVNPLSRTYHSSGPFPHRLSGILHYTAPKLPLHTLTSAQDLPLLPSPLGNIFLIRKQAPQDES